MSLPHDGGWPLPPTVPSFSSLDLRGAPSADDAEQIEKDLHRSGRLELGVTDDEVEAHYASLRRILHAWCHASNGNYSQAMGRIGMTLVVTAGPSNPEGAFLSFAWLMRSLPPTYYDNEYRVDARALRLLAAWRWPDVFVPAMYEPLELVTSQWFLSLWAGVLPMECCVAIWAEIIMAHADDEAVMAETSLRIALVLLDKSLGALHEAITADQAEVASGNTTVADPEAPSFAVETYSVLQQVARWPAGDAAGLVDKALAFKELTSESIAEARRLAESQLRVEAEKRKHERAAAKAMAEEAARMEEEKKRKEKEREEEVKSTSTRLGEQQFEAFEAEVEEEAAKKEAMREEVQQRKYDGGARTAEEAQEGDLRILDSRGRRKGAVSGCCDHLETLIVGLCTIICALPMLLVMILMALKRLIGRCCGRVDRSAANVRRKTRRGMAESDEDARRAHWEGGLEEAAGESTTSRTTPSKASSSSRWDQDGVEMTPV